MYDIKKKCMYRFFKKHVIDKRIRKKERGFYGKKLKRNVISNHSQ